jgi:hypothetical protein
MKMKNVINDRLARYKEKLSSSRGVIGNLVTGAVFVPGKQWTIYVTLLNGEVIEAINRRVPNTFTGLVLVGRDPEDFPGVTQVLGTWGSFEGETSAMGPGPHGIEHSWWTGDHQGTDITYVWGEQFYPGLCHPIAGTLKVKIYPSNYRTATGFKQVKVVTTIDLASSVPTVSGKARISLIVMDSTGAFVVRDGSLVTGWSNLVDGDIPQPEDGDNVVCAVKLFYGQKKLRKDGNNNDFIDLRLSGANSGSTVALKHHGGDHISTGGDPIPDVVAGGASGLMPGSAATKLAGIATGAEVNVNADWDATSGDAQILNKPDIPPTGITVKTVDGTVDVSNVLTMVVSNDTLTDDGSGQVTLDTGGGGGTLGAELIDLTSQVNGTETHFTFTPAAAAITVFIDGVADLVGNVTMDLDDLGFTLATAPSSTSTLQILRMTSVSGGSGHTIQDNGSAMTPRPNLNIIGATVEDDSINNATRVTIPTPSLPSWIANSPDNPPASPDSMDDEFDGASLDAKWTIQNQNSLNIDVTNGHLHLCGPSQGTHRLIGIEQIAPSGDWKFRCKVNKNSGYRNYPGFAMSVRDSTTNNFRYAIWIDTTSPGLFIDIVASGWDGYSGESNLGNNVYSSQIYMEIEHSGTNMIWRVSSDSINFTVVNTVTDASWVATPDRVGIGVYAYNCAIDYSVDWFRRIS